jgi:hypothetical protein
LNRLSTHIPPDAPSDFVEPVVAIRGVLLEKGAGNTYGCCIETSLILGWLLREQGYAVELVSCTANGWPPLVRACGGLDARPDCRTVRRRQPSTAVSI